MNIDFEKPLLAHVQELRNALAFLRLKISPATQASRKPALRHVNCTRNLVGMETPRLNRCHQIYKHVGDPLRNLLLQPQFLRYLPPSVKSAADKIVCRFVRNFVGLWARFLNWAGWRGR